jgi:putative copper export protein
VTPDVLSVVLRTLTFVALFQATGVAFFMVLFAGQLSQTRNWVCRLGLVAALAGVVLTIAHQSIDAARMADDYSGLLDADMLQLAWTSSNGAAHLLQALGLGAVALSLRRGQHRISLAVPGACIAILAALLTGHTSIHASRWLLAPLLAAHLLIVAFWFGALAPLYRVAQSESPASAAQIVARFSAIAGWLVPVIAMAGLCMALILAPDFSVLKRRYGQLLIVKLTGFVLLMLLAAYNKWWLTPALATDDATPRSRLQRVIAVEFLLLSAVLTATAILTTFYSPET